jgi:DNA-binding transcriptional LysR family regulator
VTLLPALAARSVPADIALLRLHADDESVRRIFAATPSGRTRAPAVSEFFGYLEKVARQFR